MPYEEINDNIDHILRAVGPAHVAQYDWLIQNIRQVTEPEYQRRYKAFWRLSGAVYLKLIVMRTFNSSKLA